MSGRAAIDQSAVRRGARGGEADVNADQGAARPPRALAQARDERARLHLAIERGDPIEIGSRREGAAERHAIERRPAPVQEILDDPLEVVGRSHPLVGDQALDSPRKGEPAPRKRAVAVLQGDEKRSRSSIALDDRDGPGFDERGDPVAIVGFRPLQEHHEVATLESHAPVQMPRVPAQEQGGLEILRPQPPLSCSPTWTRMARSGSSRRMTPSVSRSSRARLIAQSVPLSVAQRSRRRSDSPGGKIRYSIRSRWPSSWRWPAMAGSSRWPITPASLSILESWRPAGARQLRWAPDAVVASVGVEA
jgi:hypothetical protein